MKNIRLAIVSALVIPLLSIAGWVAAPRSSQYLVVWAMEVQHPQAKFAVSPGQTAALGLGRDFIAVYDVAPTSKSFGKLLTMLPAGPASFVHHTNYTMPPNHVLYANDWLGNHTYVFDLAHLLHPRLLRQFQSVGGFGWAHSFAYLPDGNTLATFQFSGGFNQAPGGLVEFDPNGKVIRTSSAAAPVDANIRPYSLAVIPSLDRVVTGSAPMAAHSVPSHVAQIWRLSDLRLLQTLALPDGALDAFEPRVLADGVTVVVPTADCHLFLVHGLAGDQPSLDPIYRFPDADCEVPAVSGNYYLQPSMRGHSITSLDLSDPSHPRLAGRLAMPAGDAPHWVAVEPGGNRVATLDPATGALRLAPEHIDLGPRHWPDGWSGAAVPHAAIFDPRR